MAEACYGDQQMLGARGGKGTPKPAPVTRSPKVAMKGGKLRKPGGGKHARF